MTTIVVAVLMDILAREHPVHTLSLGLVAIATAAIRLKLDGRFDDVLAAVSAALVAQPALHATAVLGPRPHLDGPLHVVAADGPALAVQITVTTLVVVAVGTCSRFLALLMRTVRAPLRLLEAAAQSTPVHVVPGRPTRGHGLPPRWCGWLLLSARRGPPRRRALARA